MLMKSTTSPLITLLIAGTTAFGADAPPAARKAFMALQTTYVSFEITQQGSKSFSGPKETGAEGSYQINRSLRFEVPLNAPLPGSCPTTTPMEEAMEEDRCMGWSYMAPDDPSIMEAVTSGKADLSKNPMFARGEFSVDDMTRFRSQDESTKTFTTETSTYKGSGVAYVPRSGMLLCDFKKMTCELSGVTIEGSNGDLVTVTSTSDAPGSTPGKETQDPRLLLPQIPEEIVKKMTGFPLTLPDPSTVTFTAPGTYRNAAGPDVVVRMTISSRSTARAGPASK
jgi:hypothetical protein